MRVGELCIRDVVVATAEESVIEAARRMIAHHVGSLVVVDEIDGLRRPIGMITDRDLVSATIIGDLGHGRALSIGDVMSREVLTAQEDEDVFAALQRMRAGGVRRLPIVDRTGALVGILAFDDYLEWLGEQLGELTRLLASEQRRERSRE